MASFKRSLSSLKKKEINTLFSSIIMRFKKEGLALKFAPTKNPFGRILIIIPKKIGNAPTRNLIRRRIKSAFYENKWYENKVDTIIKIFPEAQTLSFQEIVDIMAEAFKLFNKKYTHLLNSHNSTDSRDL